MFHSARVTLTIWYVLIIMLISLIFSAIIYNSLIQEVDRALRMQRVRIERLNGAIFIRPQNTAADPEILEESRNRILLSLAGINALVLIGSGAAAYFLAGKTLQPIERMVKEQDRFVADASHEIRTPLTALKTSIEVALRDKAITLKEAKETMADSLDDVNALQKLSESLLLLGHANDVGRNHFSVTPIKDILDHAFAKVAPMAKQKDMTFAMTTDDSVVTVDVPSITEAFTVLFDNAIKYSAEKTTVTVSARKVDNVVETTVADQGIGIAEKDLVHIFDRFYRADKSRTKTDASGYGLGLAIAKQSVENHGGSIRVKSMLGQGTTFTVRLPISPRPAEPQVSTGNT